MLFTLFLSAEPINVDENEQKVVIVKEGDTLWDLCETYLGDPFLWPKVWSINPQIENAHLIEPGDKIYFNLTTGEVKIEKVVEIDNKDEYKTDFQTGPTIKTSKYKKVRFMEKKTTSIGVRNDAILSRNKFKEAGTIFGSQKENILLTQNDEVFLKFKKLKEVHKGDKFNIFRIRKKIKHPIRSEEFGYLIDILGEITIIGKTASRAIGNINLAYNEIERGDYILPKIDLSLNIEKKENKKRIDGYIIEAFKNSDSLGSNELVFIDKGAEDGVEKGNKFYIIRHRDPITNKVVPSYVIGKLIVMSTTKETSTCFIYRSKKEIFRGDIISTIAPKNVKIFDNQNEVEKVESKTENKVKDVSEKVNDIEENNDVVEEDKKFDEVEELE